MQYSGMKFPKTDVFYFPLLSKNIVSLFLLINTFK